MRQIPPLVDKRILTPAQAALALELIDQMDLLRLKSIARMYARGLPPEVAWDDTLQEALTRVIAGSRQRPEGVTTALTTELSARDNPDTEDPPFRPAHLWYSQDSVCSPRCSDALGARPCPSAPSPEP